VQLGGSCVLSDSAATLVYYVGGKPATNATCPDPGVPLVVSVRPSYPARPDCSYNTTAAYNLTSEPRPRGAGTPPGVAEAREAAAALPRRAHPLTCGPPPTPIPGPGCGLPPGCPAVPTVTCTHVPVCTSANQSVQLSGACTTSDPAADLLYIVDGQLSLGTSAPCPAPGATIVVSAKPVFPTQLGCCYPVQPVFNLTSERPRL
jgi:hypothetical protein